MNTRFRPRREIDTTRINNAIRVPQIRTIDPDGNPLGILPVRQALEMAERLELDLVEIAPNADPPVCRIMDYGKFKYEKSKKSKEAKKKQHIVHLKEIKLRPKTGEHDYLYKMEHAREFLLKGDRVKATVVFRGREIAHLEFGIQLLSRFNQDISDIAQTEQQGKREGRNLISIFVPDKDKIKQFKRKIELEEKKRRELEAIEHTTSESTDFQ